MRRRAVASAIAVVAIVLALLVPAPAGAAVQQPGMAWAKVSTSGPSARQNYAMAYDQATSQMLLFGGNDGSGTISADTWLWSGSAWSATSPSNSPSARYNAMIAYDPATAQLVLFGGNDGSRRGDTWLWDGSTWTKAAPASSPPARAAGVLEFDAATGQLVLFGGIGVSSTVLNDTWTWDGSTWTQQNPGTSPGPRKDSSLTFDPATGQLLLFGGNDGSATTNETWNWTGTTWSLLTGATPPSARGTHGSAFDPVLGQLLAYGGTTDTTTYRWSGTAWSALSVGAVPANRQGIEMAFDPRNGQVLFFGGNGTSGNNAFGDTWALSADPLTGMTWQSAATTGPSGRAGMATGFDPATGQLLLFGGYNGASASTPLGDTWAWDGTAWTEVTPSSGSPPARWYSTLAFDPATGQMLLFGGRNGSGALGDTWVWTFTGGVGTWTERTPGGSGNSPSARWGASMAFDPATGQMLLNGGTNGSAAASTMGDTWKWTGSTWTQLTSTQTPGARAFTSIGYDQNSHQMLLVGGTSGSTQYADTYAWNGSTDWTLVSSTTGSAIPSARDFDPRFGRTVVFGLASGQTWSWDGSTWTYQSAASVPPIWASGGMRDGDTTVTFDPATGQSVMFGGYQASPQQYNSTTYVLTYRAEVIGAAASTSTGLTGYDQTVSFAPTIQINVPSTYGWNATIQANQVPTSGSSTLPALRLNGAAAASISSSTAPTDTCSGSCVATASGTTLSYPITLSSSPTRFYSVRSGTGVGRFVLGVKLWAQIPASARAGTYTSTLTITSSTGP